MLKAVFRWILVLAALLLVGPLLGSLLGFGTTAIGARGTTIFIGTRPVGTLLGALATMSGAAALGLIGARFMARDMGYMVAGIVLSWAAWHLGLIQNIIQAQPVDAKVGTIWGTLAAEHAMLAALGLGLAMAIERLGTNDHGQPMTTPDPALTLGERIKSRFLEETPDAKPIAVSLGGSIVTGAILAGALASLIVYESLKGQTVMGVALAALGAGAGSQIIASMLGVRLTPLTPIAATLVVSIVAPIVGMVTLKDPVLAATSGRFLGMLRPTSLDWAAGAFLGAPIGIAWANSMLERPAVVGAKPA